MLTVNVSRSRAKCHFQNWLLIWTISKYHICIVCTRNILGGSGLGCSIFGQLVFLLMSPLVSLLRWHWGTFKSIYSASWIPNSNRDSQLWPNQRLHNSPEAIWHTQRRGFDRQRWFGSRSLFICFQLAFWLRCDLCRGIFVSWAM